MNICVFCSSSNALDKKYFDAAGKLGNLMANAKHKLVYGGSNVGLMNKLAMTIQENGSHVTGVIPEVIKSKGLAYADADELIVTADLSERKKTMIEISDAFIALPGGFGTLEEILEVVTLKQLQVHNKAIVFINTGNYYSKLADFFDVVYQELFAKNEYRNYYTIVDTPEEAIDYIENYNPPEFKDKWFNVDSEEFLSNVNKSDY